MTPRQLAMSQERQKKVEGLAKDKDEKEKKRLDAKAAKKEKGKKINIWSRRDSRYHDLIIFFLK